MHGRPEGDNLTGAAVATINPWRRKRLAYAARPKEKPSRQREEKLER